MRLGMQVRLSASQAKVGVLTQEDTGPLKYMGRDMIRVSLSEIGLAVGDISVIWARGAGDLDQILGRMKEVKGR